MRLVTIILSIFLLFSFSFADERVEKIDKILTDLQQQSGFNSNVLLAEKGKIIYEKSFGYANYDDKTLLTKDNIFDIASVSKTFTAVAILKLEEKGKLKLDDKITKYLPDLPYKNVTIRQMLSHTSGIIEFQKPIIRKEIQGKNVNNTQMKNVFVKIKPKLDFTPGTKWSYSNTNYLFLAMIIEKVSGKSYAQFIDKYIFRKAKMKDSYVLESGVPNNKKGRIVERFYRDGLLSPIYINANKLGFMKRYKSTYDNTTGSGKIHSTARDLLKYHKALQKGKLLKKQSLQKMYEPVKLTTGKDYKVSPVPNYPSEYGLGWEVAIDDSEGKIVYHPGGEPGTRTYLLRNVTKDRCMIIMTNNTLTDHRSFTFPMRVLENRSFELDKKLTGLAIAREYESNGIESALKKYRELENNKNYRLREDDINTLGYEILEKNKIKDAIEIFKINTEKFPKSGNVWDSLGEAYLKDGKKEEAIKYYKKSLELDPKNDNAKEILEKIRKGKIK